MDKKNSWLSEILTDRFERIRRRPDYRRAIEDLRELFSIRAEHDQKESKSEAYALAKLEGKTDVEALAVSKSTAKPIKIFDDTGFEADHPYSADPEFTEIRESFGLRCLFLPSTVPPDDIEQLPIFKNQLAVEPIFEVEGLDSDSDTPIEINAVTRGRFLKLKIDLDHSWTNKEILESVKEYVDAFRDIDSEERKKERYRKERQMYYQIWDLRKENMPFQDIVYRLNPTFPKLTVDSAKKGFLKAYELIVGMKYNKATWKDIVFEQLRDFRDNPQKMGKILKKGEKPLAEKLPDAKDVREYAADTNENRTEYGLRSFELNQSIQKLCGDCPKAHCREGLLSCINGEPYFIEDDAKNCERFLDFINIL